MFTRVLLTVISLATLNPAHAAAQSWVPLVPGAGPVPDARRHASAIYDAGNHRMVIFAGEDGSGRRNDVWAFDLATNSWTDITPTSGPAPAVRRTPGSVYDAAGARMITWSGQGGGFFNDSWSFDLTNHAWTLHVPPGSVPNPRYGVAVVFDPLAGELVSFAGFTNAGRFDDTWRFDADTEVWTDATPVGVSPDMRCLHSASYDSRGHRMIMYGGQQNGPLDDIWAFDLSADSWSELTPVVRPQGRFFAAHVYDSLNHRSTIFGGTRGASGGVTNEVWLFDLYLNEFVQLNPTGTSPSAREGSVGIYIEAEDRMVVFGGFDTDYRDDVWSLENLSLTATGVPLPLRPARAVLHASEPNPFNPTTRLRFELSGSGRASLRIYDAMGRPVATLFDEEREAGEAWVRWNGRGDDGRILPSGIYLARLRQGELSSARKLILAK